MGWGYGRGSGAYRQCGIEAEERIGHGENAILMDADLLDVRLSHWEMTATHGTVKYGFEF